MTTNKPTTTPHSYRLGKRQEDYFVRLSPFDPLLTEVGRLRHQGHEYVVLRHDHTGTLYARDINDVRLIRAYRTYQEVAKPPRVSTTTLGARP